MIIGAYAAMPLSRPQQEFLAGLGFATGLEIPWRASALDPDPAWLDSLLAASRTAS
ncbi:hypothetical protein [Trueperella pyogenes]|uniref:hypothetical protein n=1 Tax=Trueperella pyogenes TaxID=1661 RepID=UPI0016711322|nr:hypothetical protein [Trueperella pyogenes]